MVKLSPKSKAIFKSKVVLWSALNHSKNLVNVSYTSCFQNIVDTKAKLQTGSCFSLNYQMKPSGVCNGQAHYTNQLSKGFLRQECNSDNSSKSVTLSLSKCRQTQQIKFSRYHPSNFASLLRILLILEYAHDPDILS